MSHPAPSGTVPWLPGACAVVAVLLPAVALASPPFAAQYQVGPKPRAIVGGDFTGDGWVDLVAACNDVDAPEVSFLRGAGGGRFDPSVKAIAWGRPYDVGAGDFDEDGKLDLAVTSGAPLGTVPPDPRGMRIFFGDGAGGFPRASEVYAIAGDPGDPRLVVADANADGHLDVIVVGCVSGRADPIQTLLGDGRGGFAPVGRDEALPGPRAYGIAGGDVDEDGRLDLVVLRSDRGQLDEIQLAFGAGDGTFAPAGDPVDAGCGGAASVSLADLDGDGHLDLACALSGSSRIAVHYGRGDGSFEPPALVDTPPQPQWVGVADWNVDGLPDLCAFSSGTNPRAMTFFPNLGGRRFGRPVDSLIEDWSVTGPAAPLDVDGDGADDLVAALGGLGRVAVLLGGLPSGPAGVRYVPTIGGTCAYRMAAGDLDGDGRTDVVLPVGAWYKAVLSFTGRDDGSFLPAGTFSVPGERANPYGIACADVNGDGLNDVVVADTNQGLPVFLGDGAGGLAYRGTCNEGTGTSCVAVGRLDGDAHPDLVAVAWSQHRLFVLLGDGTGDFGEPVVYDLDPQASSTPGSIALADVDGDGNLDCVVDVRDNQPVRILWGDGTGVFEGPASAAPALPWGRNSSGGGVAAADLDADGVVDLVELDRTGGRIYIWHGLGGRRFADPIERTVGNQPEGLLAADLDADRNADLAIGVADPDPAGGRPSAVIVFWSHGAWDPALGPFAAPDVIRLPQKPTMLLAADMDGNGAPELIALPCSALYTIMNPLRPASVEIARATPAVGPRKGGTRVTLRGRGFRPDMEIRFGDGVAPNVGFVDPRTLTVTTPPRDEEGYVDVRVGSAVLENGFLYRDERGITALEPDWAPLGGGIRVTIRGAGFQPAGGVHVLLGPEEAQVVSASASEIVITTPRVSRSGAVGVLVRDAGGELILPGAFFFGRKKAPPVGTVSIVPTEGGRKISWSNTGGYDQVVLTRSDGMQVVLDGDATHYTDRDAGAVDAEGYEIAGVVSGLQSSDVHVANPSDFSACPFRYAVGNTRRPSDGPPIPLRLGIIYGAKIALPGDVAGVPVNRFVLSALVRRTTLWGELVARIYTTNLDGDRFELVADGIVMPAPVTPTDGPVWVQRTVELHPDPEGPCNHGITVDRFGIPTCTLFFCLYARLRDGEEAPGSPVAPFWLGVDDGPVEPTLQVYVENEQCGVPMNILPATECHGAIIRRVTAPDPMIRILPLTGSDPRLEIAEVTYEEIAPPHGGGGGGFSVAPRATLPGRSFTFHVDLKPDSGPGPFPPPGAGGAPAVLSYTWAFGDGSEAVTAAPDVAHTYHLDGVYTLRVTARSAACESAVSPPYRLHIAVGHPGEAIMESAVIASAYEFGDSMIVGFPVRTEGELCSGPGIFRPLVAQQIMEGDRAIRGVTFEIDIDGDGEPDAPPVEAETWGCDPPKLCWWEARLDPASWSWPASLGDASESTGSLRVYVEEEGQAPRLEEEREVRFRRPPAAVRPDWELADLAEAPQAWVDTNREYHFRVRFPDLLDWSKRVTLLGFDFDNYAKAYAQFQLDRLRDPSAPTGYAWRAEANAVLALTLMDSDLVDEGVSRQWALADTTGTLACNYLEQELGPVVCMELAYRELARKNFAVVPEIEIPVIDLGVADLSLYGSIWLTLDLGVGGGLSFDASETDLDFGSINGFYLTLVPGAGLSLELGGSLDLVVVELKAGVQACGGLRLPITFTGGFEVDPETGRVTWRDFDRNVHIDDCWEMAFYLKGGVCVGIWIFKKCWSGTWQIDCWDTCGLPDCGAICQAGKRGKGEDGEEPPGAIVSGPAACAGGGRVVQVLVRDVDPSPQGVASRLFWTMRPDDGEWSPDVPMFDPTNGRPKLNPAVAWIPDAAGGAGHFLAAWTEIALTDEQIEALQEADDMAGILSAQEIFVAVLDPATEVWSAPMRLTDDAFPDGMAAVCADADPDRARIAWVRFEDGAGPGGKLLEGDSMLRSCVVDVAAGQVVGGMQDLGRGNGRIDKQPALVSGLGQVVLAWVEDEDRSPATKTDRRVRLASLDAGGALVPRQAFDAPGAAHPDIAITEAGGSARVGVVWEREPVFDGAPALAASLAWPTVLNQCPHQANVPCMAPIPKGMGYVTWDPGPDWDAGDFVGFGDLSVDGVLEWQDEAGGFVEGGIIQDGTVHVEGLRPHIVDADGAFDVGFTYYGIGAERGRVYGFAN